MSDEDNLPALRGSSALATTRMATLMKTSSLISGAVSIFETWADTRLALRTRAKADYLKALEEAGKNYEGLERQLGRLADLPNILAEDQAERDESRSEAAHQRRLRARQRMREWNDESHKDALQVWRNEKDFAEAQDDAIIAQRGRDAARTISPDKIEEERLKARQNRHRAFENEASADAKAFIVDLQRVAARRDEPQKTEHQNTVDRLDEFSAVIEDEIAKAKQRGVSADVVAGLRNVLQRVYALRNEQS